MKRIILATIIALTMTISATAQNLQKGNYGYLYCHMSDNGEWTAFAVSRDGYNYHDIMGGKPILTTPNSTHALRAARATLSSPALMTAKDMMVTTDMCVRKSHIWDNYGIDLLKSNDLIHWTSVTFDYRKGEGIFCDPEVAVAIQRLRPSTVYGRRRYSGTPTIHGITATRADT